MATFVAGSGVFVRQGYVSSTRYTHYSLLRTVEAALGLGTLTDNDRYADAFDDVFTHGKGQGSGERPRTRAPFRGAASGGARGRGWVGRCWQPAGPCWQLAGPRERLSRSVGAAGGAAGAAGGAAAGPTGSLIRGLGPVAYARQLAAGTVTPLDLNTRRAEAPIRVGREPVAVAIARASSTAYVVNEGSNSVTPIDVVTNRPGRSIRSARRRVPSPSHRTAPPSMWSTLTRTP